jgi:hypothetical protein
MSEFLEKLKLRLAEAQQRHGQATARLQAAQAEHQAATQDFASWQNAVRTETLREQQATAVKTLHVSIADTTSEPTNAPATVSATNTVREEPNKTDAIRQILRSHSDGLHPVDIWKRIGSQFTHRAYMYSVLKRLKDRQEVCVKRGKYFIKAMPKIEEDDERVTTMVQ